MDSRKLFKHIMSLLLFGTNGVIASYISLTSSEIVLTRTFIGSLFLLAIFLIKRGKVTFYKDKMQALFVLISGVAMGMSWMLLYEAYELTGVSIASLLYYCGPVVVMILSPLLFKEKLTKIKIIGFGMVVIGIICLNSGITDSLNEKGLVVGLLSAVMYAVMVIFNKKAKNITGMENTIIQLLVSFLTVAVFVIVKQGAAINILPSDVIPILILGVINTGIGCYLYFSSIGYLPVQTVSICGYLEPLSAVLLSAVILGETMHIVQIIGAVLILCGAAGSELIKQEKTKLNR